MLGEVAQVLVGHLSLMHVDVLRVHTAVSLKQQRVIMVTALLSGTKMQNAPWTLHTASALWREPLSQLMKAAGDPVQGFHVQLLHESADQGGDSISCVLHGR